MPGIDYQSRRKRRGPKRLTERPLVLAVEAFFCLAILGGAGWGVRDRLYRSEEFLVKKIQVNGAKALQEEDIVAAAGITRADSVLGVDCGMVEARILTLPYVKTCRVTRSFPDKVVIAIEERTPLATLLADNHSFQIDAEGVVLNELPMNVAHDGPYVSGVPGLGFVEVGRRLTQPSLAAALQAWREFSKTSMAKDVTVSEFAAPATNDIRMYCDELPYEVRWGRGNFADQAARLDFLWKSKNRRIGCTEYLDLRFGDDVVCK